MTVRTCLYYIHKSQADLVTLFLKFFWQLQLTHIPGMPVCTKKRDSAVIRVVSVFNLLFLITGSSPAAVLWSDDF